MENLEYIPDTILSQDSVRGADSIIFRDSMITDSTALHDTLSFADPLTEIFGEYSFIPSNIPLRETISTVSVADNSIYQLAVICLMVFYFYLVMNYRGETVLLFKFFSFKKRKGRFTDDHGRIQNVFTNSMTVTGLLMAGIVAAKVFDIFMSPSLQADYSESIFRIKDPVIITGVTMAVIVLIALLQRWIINAAGALTFNDRISAKLLWLKQLFFILYTVTATPFVLICALAPIRLAISALCVIAIITAFFIIYYCYRSLLFFMKQKVSILLWFLYLCIVEIMPVGIIVLTILRNTGL